METDAESAVFEALSESPPSKTNLLVISYRDDPDDWIANWRRHVGTTPANFGFIHVGATARSAAAPSAGAQSGSPNIVTAVNDPADLTGIGIQISDYLKGWAGTENRTIVYFDSLTVLLQFTELNRAYRFLHVLSGRIRSADGRAYYRLDPDAHDQQTISTIKELLDGITELP